MAIKAVDAWCRRLAAGSKPASRIRLLQMAAGGFRMASGKGMTGNTVGKAAGVDRFLRHKGTSDGIQSMLFLQIAFHCFEDDGVHTSC
jgi:hypothetical protein